MATELNVEPIISLMRDKILAALRAKYPGTQSALLDRVADTMAGTVTNETLETVASGDGVKNLLAFFQSELDRRTTEVVNTAVSNYEKKHSLKDGKPVAAEPPKPAEDPTAPEWAKALIKQNQELTAKFQLLEKGAATTGLMDKVKAKLTEKKIPDAFLKGRVIEKEEDVDKLVTEIEGDFQTVKQTMVNQGVVIDVPVGSTKTAEKVDSDIEAWAASKNPPKN